MTAKLTKDEKAVIRELAEKCAGVPIGQKLGRWTHEERVAVVYSVMCSLFRISKSKK